ncbi:amidohydrolase family protein [Amycolatopsis sp. NPDC021455]|uniref:amidohydrolase family protein n=1 Tax=Amycolatopsis sp. NPDC021455 TaxID=3154901 RepID=UPI0033F76D81
MIDIHVHLADARCLSPGFIAGIAESILDDGQAGGSRVKRVLPLYLQDRDGGRLLSQMAAHGITKSILLIADFGAALGEPALTIEEVHEHHASVVRASDGRLAFFAGFDPSRGPSALELVRYWTARPECEGVKLYPPCGFELDDERLLPLWQHCNDNGIPVLTHSGPSLPRLARARRYPHSLETVVRRFPDIRIALAHGMVWDLEGTVRLLQQYPGNLYADISSFHQLSEDELELMLEGCAKVPGQVLFGSDAPLFDFSGNLREAIDRMRRHLSPALQAGLFDLNARRFLSGADA